MPALKDVVDLLHGWYPPATADSWDAVGLVCGDPDQRVDKVLFAVDPTLEVAREAAEWGADLLVVHHPLFLKPVHGFAATTPKGRTLATLAGAGCALLTAHTNADQAVGGVSEALALALGLTDLAPIAAGAGRPRRTSSRRTSRSTTPTPVRAALAEAGAGRIGDYDHASFSTPGQGRFRPLEGANPTIGAVGRDRDRRRGADRGGAARGACAAAVVARAAGRAPLRGAGVRRRRARRPGPGRDRHRPDRHRRAETTLARVRRDGGRRRCPTTAHGVRVAGRPGPAGTPGRGVRGSGRLPARHGRRAPTPTSTSPATCGTTRRASSSSRTGPALVDVAHWAAEWTWLPVVEARLRARRWGDTVETRVSTIRTDPWQFRRLRSTR